MFRCIRDASTLSPQNFDYARRAALTALMIGDHKQCVKLATKAIALAAEPDAELYVARAKANQALGDTAAGLLDVAEAEVLEPEREGLQLLRRQLRKARWSGSIIRLVWGDKEK